MVFCSMDFLWWTCWLLHSHVYMFKYFPACVHVYFYSDDVSLTRNADKAFLKPKWAKAKFPHINFGLALIYPNQTKLDRKGDPNQLSQQKIEVRVSLWRNRMHNFHFLESGFLLNTHQNHSSSYNCKLSVRAAPFMQWQDANTSVRSTHELPCVIVIPYKRNKSIHPVHIFQVKWQQ